jgi:ElaB/YqjD/DUF883 family membrane-anchored ribosome-binding protein
MESVSATARRAGEYANGQLNNFISSVEDLTNALKNVESPEIERVRAKVKLALVAARSAVADTASQLRNQAQEAGTRTDRYVHDNPWPVIGLAAVVGLAVGMLASRRS